MTTIVNIGCALSAAGKKVLDIDLDPQGSLTVSLDYDDNDNMKMTIATLMELAIETSTHLILYFLWIYVDRRDITGIEPCAAPYQIDRERLSF